MTQRVFIGLGSNLGERENFLSRALASFPPKIFVEKRSSIYETEPWGYENQNRFLNQVVEVETDLSPEDLLKSLKRIEKNLGREKTFRYGPRRIDLDILLYDDQIMQTSLLTIPHPKMPERAFVLIPLKEIAPDLVHPGLEKTIADLSENVSRKGIKKYEPELNHD